MPEIVSSSREPRLVAGASLALLAAIVRYAFSVAALVRRELAHWARRADAIDDPGLRALALRKLDEERFNAEAAAMLATRAPRHHRAAAVRAIIALQVMFDYLDGVSEASSADAPAASRRAFRAFTEGVDPPKQRPNAGLPEAVQSGYLVELSSAARSALGGLPAAGAVSEALKLSAERGAEAQVRAHAAARTGTRQLEGWAQAEAAKTGLEWREFLAGAAASVLGVHALIAAAADRRTTPQEAMAINAAYLPICALTTLLDGLVDHDGDARVGEPGYLRFYPDRRVVAQALASVAEQGVSRARTLRHADHHVMTLAGIVAYYGTGTGAGSEFARPVAAQLKARLGALIVPALATMRAWRLAKEVRRRLVKGGAGYRSQD
jgi:tetraprenyl-beta-curcumene synthase